MVVSRKEYEASVAASRPERMKWWREARYGMFVHWGLYAQVGRNEWVQSIEGIPVDEYAQLASTFKPKDRPAREWAQLAARSGMKYMVMTTKHHEGFCLWDSKQTDFNAVKACGRDLVAEYVEACREFGLRIGFYYSLMDWHHPDGARAAYDPEARRRFVDFTKGCVEELVTNYGKIDVLWYDVARPFESHEGWESVAMNQMVRARQPDIIVNNRSRLPEDFGTPEGRVQATEAGRDWEACMTFDSASWGYMPSAAQDCWTPRQILKMLNTACAGSGNLLLNIGPKPDGSVPDAAVAPLTTVGTWLADNGEAVYGALDRVNVRGASACGGFSGHGRTLYFWCRHWPGEDIALGGFKTALRRAKFLVSGDPITFEQQPSRIMFKGLPKGCPDATAGVTVMQLEFEDVPEHARGPTTPALWV
jgi:alpha-L-fucosidase